MSSSLVYSSIRMGFWNVGGLLSKTYNKMTDATFLNQIEKFDIIFLAETHIGHELQNYKIGNYYSHFVCRSASKHNNRSFGGLAMLCKKEFKPHIKILKNTKADFQWIKLEKDFFNFEKDLFVCMIYNPPENSSYSKNIDYDILDCIEKEMTYYKSKGNILLCGDFNARVSTDPDFIANDDNTFLPLYSSYTIDSQIKNRHNMDPKLDNRGKELLDMCVANQLRILNGRTFGDMFGKYTCFTPNGCSTVDYVLASENILNQILYFNISDFLPTLSDCHCLLQWSMSARFSFKSDNTKDTCLHPVSPNYIWSDESPALFQTALNSINIQEKLQNLISCKNLDSQELIDNAAAELSNVIIKAADKSLRKSKNKPIKTNKKMYKWFDVDLKNMRRSLINYGKIYSKFPKDPTVKNHYYKLYREYTKTRKFKCREFKQSLLKQLETLHEENPKSYWKLIEKIQGVEKNDNTDAIDPKSWISHFGDLNKPKPKFNERLVQLDGILKQLEKEKCFNDLDKHISLSEISNAISKIKVGKAPGLDKISNYMIKYGQTHLLPCFHNIFNSCLTFGHYPKPWSSGYITPIHKGNDTNDPNNYRGITVTNAVGKLFNKILDIRLDKFLSKHHIINECQIGFTQKARTSDHMFILKTIIDKYCKTKDGRVYACFIDFHKAFDTVIHSGIKIKLLKIGVGTNFYQVIQSMYSSSKSCVRVSNGITDFISVKVGVKQGDNLSPNLFKVFINDLPDYLNSSQDPVVLNSRAFNCLMYADDIILLSSSANGLQQKLDILQCYCNDWCLSVNFLKTKVLIFNKAGRLLKTKFYLDGTELECVSNYKYLGISFCSSGSFSLAQKQLYQKALKALFKLKKDFISLNPDIKTIIHIFDHTIKPLLLYSSEIWGYFNPFSRKSTSSGGSVDKIYSNQLCDKLHIKFCKSILGVHKSATNVAVLSELGRFPLHFDILKSMLSYWYRLENLGQSFPLLVDAYKESKSLFEQNSSSWYSSIDYFVNNINGVKDLPCKGAYQFKKALKDCLFKYYIKEWHLHLKSHSDKKLCCFSTFKQNFGFEKYLRLIQNFEQRRSLIRFRISAHRLNIERGRYLGIPRHERICLRCDSNSVDDEKHFLLSCSHLSEERAILFQMIDKLCKNFVKMDDVQKLIWLMTNEDEKILIQVSKMILSSGI